MNLIHVFYFVINVTEILLFDFLNKSNYCLEFLVKKINIFGDIILDKINKTDMKNSNLYTAYCLVCKCILFNKKELCSSCDGNPLR